MNDAFVPAADAAFFINKITWARNMIPGVCTYIIGIGAALYKADLLRIPGISGRERCLVRNLPYFCFCQVPERKDGF